MRSIFPTLQACCVLAGLAALADSPTVAAESRIRPVLQRQQAERFAGFTRDIEQLAAAVRESGDAQAAAEILRWARQVDAATLDDLPVHVQPARLPALDIDEQVWRARLRRLREAYAQDLYILSRRALREGLASLAFEMIREAAWFDPDHKQARGLLGYVRYEDEWTTPFAAAQLRRGYVDHPRFGWLPVGHVTRYENGERFFEGRWISAEREAAIRQDFRHAWEVTTDHFEIRTNHSLERGVQLGRVLEDFHRYFKRTLAGFFNTPQQIQKLFEGGGPAPTAHRHSVVYFRTQQEFIDRLKHKQPGIEVSNGLYLPDDRTSYLFDQAAGEDKFEDTVFHEVTHQLLHESQRIEGPIGREAHFWVIEGIACYMESFHRADGKLIVGDPSHPRMHWARHRLLEENFYVPLAQLHAMGMADFQTDVQTMRALYSQSTGLAHFFMHYEDGIYRDALIEYLSDVYSPTLRSRQRARSVAHIAGVPFEELDRQYRDYLQQMQERSSVISDQTP